MGLFSPATKEDVKARIGLAGPTGSGKTFTALRIARGLAGPDGRVALVDTERGSARLYAHRFRFDDARMRPPFLVDKYRRAIVEAGEAGYDVLIVDSITHAWNGQGGVLDAVDAEAVRNRQGNKFAAWQHGSELWRGLIDELLGYPGHIIVTMRSKMDYVQQEDARGKKEVVKLGMAPEARDGLEYEFTLVGDLDYRHRMTVSKSRIDELADAVVDYPGEDFGEAIAAWLSATPPEQDPGFDRADRPAAAVEEPPAVEEEPPAEPPAEVDGDAPPGECRSCLDYVPAGVDYCDACEALPSPA